MQGLEIIPAFGAGFLGDIATAVFQVNVPDAILESLQARYDVAIAGSEHVVPGVKNQTNGLRVSQFEELCYLIGGFDVPCAMVMEDGTQPGGFGDGVGDGIRAVCKHFPLRRSEGKVWADAPGIQSPLGHSAVLVGKHEEGSGIARDFRDEMRSPESSFDSGCVRSEEHTSEL